MIGVEDKKFSGTETVAEKHKSEEYDGFRHLFYEDIETMTIKNAEEWQKFYDQWVQKQNAHFLDRKEYYPNIKQTVAIQCHKLKIQAFSQEELEMELK